MSFKTRSLTFDLSPESIDRVSEWFVENQVEIGIERSERVRSRLVFEEALLDFAEHFGDEKEVTAFFERRFRRYRLRLVVEGPRFNPLQANESEQDVWSMSLFSAIGMRAQYIYAVGANVMRIPLPHKSMNPVLRILIAIAVGALVGVLGNALVPDPIQTLVTDTILDPLAKAWVRLLQAISGPIIFFTALNAAYGTKRISDYGGSRLETVARYFGISALAVIFTMICIRPFFPVEVAATDADGQVIGRLLAAVLEVIPGNLLEPFANADTLQLLLIAIVAGYALATLGGQASELKRIVQQVNLLGLTVAQWICAFVPYFVGLLLCFKIWTRDLELLSLIWLPLVLAIVISAAVLLAAAIVVGIRMQVNPYLLLKKLRGPFFEALRTGTLDYSSVSGLAGSCKQLLGVDSKFAEAVLPQGLVLYMPTSAVGICVFVFYAAQVQQLDIDQMWLLTAAVLAVLLAVATPPVNGANLLSFVVVFSYLGIPDSVFLDVMVFDIIFGVACIAYDQAMLQLEVVLQAGRMGFLDEDALRAPVN